MAFSAQELEAYLVRLDRRFETLDDGTVLVSLGPKQPPAVLRLAPPVLVVQVDIGAAPTGDPAREARVFRRLLELNGTDLLHVAYALQDGQMVLTAALEADHLDLNELEAVLANVDLAVAEHVPALVGLMHDAAQQRPAGTESRGT